jgi:death-on-curing protein
VNIEADDDSFISLRLGDALEIYAAIFNLSTEQAADHLRSQDALEGALGRPGSYAHYQQADVALQAAVLAHRIAETQPFVDGNKRTALVSMLTFLELNGYTLSATDQELAAWIISFSSGTTPEQIAEQLRSRIKPID